MKPLLIELVRHMRWADERVADALQTPDAPPSALRLFAHIAGAEHVWFSRLQGRTPEHAVWPELTLDAARQLATSNADLYQRLVAEADNGALSRIVHYRNSAGKDFESSVTEILTQVMLHGSHHRGQIAQTLRASGLEPPLVDYIVYSRRNQQG